MASIVKRKNRYSVVYTYKDDDGNQHQKWETFDTNADAKKRKTQIEFEQQSGTFIIPNATTVADLLEEYCSVYGVNNWAMSTYRSKKGLMYNYIIPLIGDNVLIIKHLHYISVYSLKLFIYKNGSVVFFQAFLRYINAIPSKTEHFTHTE